MKISKGKSNFLFILLVILSSGVLLSQPLPRILVAGNKFVDEHGSTIVFKGINTSDPDKLEKDGQWNPNYFRHIRSWGANIVRFPIHPKAWRERGQEAYLELLDRGIEWAGKEGMYVILDWHSIGNLRSELFQHPMYETSKTETFKFWQIMAQRYGQNTTVAFFELYNEPTLFNGRFGTCSWEEWKQVMEEVIAIIRGYDAKNIPLVAGFNWAYDLSQVTKDPIDAEGVAYVSHPYPQKRPQPWEGAWNTDWGNIAYQYPVILTEVGFCRPEDRGAHIPVISDDSYVDILDSYCARKGISYVIWVFDPNWSPMLIEDWTFKPTFAGYKWKSVLKDQH